MQRLEWAEVDRAAWSAPESVQARHGRRHSHEIGLTKREIAHDLKGPHRRPDSQLGHPWRHDEHAQLLTDGALELEQADREMLKSTCGQPRRNQAPKAAWKIDRERGGDVG